MSDNIHQRGIRDYNSDTLQLIKRGYEKNPLSEIEGSDEQKRLDAIRTELKRRGRANA